MSFMLYVIKPELKKKIFGLVINLLGDNVNNFVAVIFDIIQIYT